MSWKGAGSKGGKDSKSGNSTPSWGSDSWQKEGSHGDSWKNSWESKSQGNGKSWGQAAGDSWGQSASSKSQGKSSQGWNERPVVRPPAKQQDQAADQGWKRPAASSDSWEQEPAWKKPATDSKGKSKGDAKGGYGDAKGGYGDAKGTYGGKSKGEASDSMGAYGKSKGDTKGSYKGGSMDAKGGNAAGKGYGGKSSDPVATFKAKVEKMTKDYDTAEKVTNTTLEVAKKTLENEKATPAAIKSQVDSCDRMSKKALEIQATLSKDCEEAKKAGMPVQGSHAELTKLLAKAKSLVHQLHMVTDKLKPKLSKAQHDQDMSAKEAKDSAAFKPLLTKASQAVAAVEATVATVAQKAAPVIDSPPEGDALTEVATGIETAAKEALQKVEAAKGEFKEKFNTIQSYAPEARKSANSSLMELQKKLSDMSNQMRLYQAFTKELPKLLEAKKTVDDASDKFTGHEEEVAKAAKLAEAATLTKEDAKLIDEIFDAVSEAITASTKLVHQTMRFSDAGTKAKLTQMQTKGEELRKKMQAINAKIKKQKDVFVAADVGEIGQEKLKKVEDGVKACQSAEMPYLTGVEVLPDDESEKVLKECNDASEAATRALHDAKTWLSKKQAEAKSMEKELSEKMTTEVNELMKKMGKPEAQLSKFKKDMADRRTTAIMNSVVGAVKELESKVKAMEGDCKALKAPALEEESDDALKDAVDKTRKVLIDVNTSVTETKKMLQSKQKEARAQHNDPAVKSMFDRVEAANNKVRTFQQAIGAGEKILKARSAVTTGEEKVKELEAELEKAQKLVPAAGAKLALESVAVIDELFKSIETMCKGVSSLLSPVVRDAPAKAKSALQELLKRKDEAQKGSGTVWKDIKDARDEALCDSYIVEAEANTKAVEETSAKIEEAEKPFLIGSSLSLKDRQDALKKCEEGVHELQKALGSAKKHADDKAWESKRFGEAVAKKLKHALAEMLERKKKNQQKLSTYEKDLKERHLASKMLEAQEKVDALETEVKKTVALAEPFTKEGADKMTDEEAAEPLKAFMEADAATTQSIVALKNFLVGRLRDEKGKEENMKILKTLQERLDKVQAELATVKKSTAPFERRSLGKRMVAEATEQVGGLEAEIKKAKDKCAPLMEKEGVEFLVCSSIVCLTKALSAHMKAKTVTVEDLWKEANDGKAMKEATFVKYVAGLPEAIGADSLSCLSDERRAAMFKKLIEGKKTFDEAAFKSMFDSRYTAGEESILSTEESPESETVCKVQRDDLVVFVGEAKEVNKGLWRQKCKFGDKEGWVTTNNDKGRRRFYYYSEYRHFCFSADSVIHESGTALSKVINSVVDKLKKCGTAEDDSSKDAKEKLTKLKEDASVAQKSFEEFKKAFGAAKRDFQNKEKAELNAHIDAKNQKEAAPYLEGPKSKVEAVEAAAKAAEEAGSSMASLTGDDLSAFATPGTVSSAVEKSAAETNQKAAEAKEAIKEQQKAVGEVKPGTGGTAEAAKQLKALSSKVDEALRNVTKISATVKKQCRTIVDPKMDSVAEALRKHAEEKGMSAEGLFDSLKDGEKIPEAAFCSLVASLEGASCNAEVAKLIAQKLEADGISKNAFIGFVVIYYKVVKGIAFTDEVDISKCKTLRKADMGEVLEALGSPVVDESNGMTRVRCKALQAPPCEGWVTLAGNQGTAFLEKTAKP